jgi:hypothetical protein
VSDSFLRSFIAYSIAEGTPATVESYKRPIQPRLALGFFLMAGQHQSRYCSRRGMNAFVSFDTTAFFSETALEKALLAILDSALDASNAQFGNIQIRLPETNALRLIVQRGFKRPFLEFFRIVSNDATSACGAAFDDAERVVVYDVQSSRRYDDASRRTMLTAGALACQSTPIVVRDHSVVGMLSTHFAKPHRCSDRQLRHIDALAREAAVLMARRTTHSTSAGVMRMREALRDESTKTRVIRGR